MPTEFDVRLHRALENPRLPDNLTAFQRGWRSARDHAADEIDFPTLQARLKRAKTAVTADLDRYLEEFRLPRKGPVRPSTWPAMRLMPIASFWRSRGVTTSRSSRSPSQW